MMSSVPLVYIVIVNWNRKQVTLDCLTSLAAISYPRSRIIIVDNASTDYSVVAIREQFPDAIVLEQGQNTRFAGGSNAGMRYALEQGADAILLLNNDTTVASDFLDHMVSRLQSDPDIGMVAPKIYYFDEPKRIWFAGGTVSFWTGTMKHIGIREIDHGQWDTGRVIDYASGCCILARRSLVEQIGFLDESYYMYTEDADWSLRARRAGYRIMYEPRAHVWHKLSVSTGGHLAWYKMEHKFLSNLRFFRRFASWYHWLCFPWLNILVNGFATVRYLLRTKH